jgi:hypothetical protein
MYAGNLLYNSATDVQLTRSELSGLVTPEPLGARHAPYSFAEFADNTHDAIEAAGYRVDNEQFVVTKDGNRLFGLMQVALDPTHADYPTSNVFDNVLPPYPRKPEHLKHKLLVGLRGAHDQRVSRGLLIGSKVLVCSNLCFHGDLGNWKSKQTTNIAHRIPALIGQAVNGLDHARTALSDTFKRLNDTPIGRSKGDEILATVYRNKGLSASQLGRALDEWGTSTIGEHTSGGRNAWWLLNAATEALKPTGQNVSHLDTESRSRTVYRTIRAEAAWSLNPGYNVYDPAA